MTKGTTLTSKLDSDVRVLFRGAARAAPLHFCIDVAPVPASRPRVTRWGTYYGKTYKNWMKNAAESLAKQDDEFWLFREKCAVFLEIVAERPKTTKRSEPRGDVDNYAKAALDAITKTEMVWDDDDQVVALFVSKRFAETDESPRTEVEVYPL